jgi:hypothetical protein
MVWWRSTSFTPWGQIGGSRGQRRIPPSATLGPARKNSVLDSLAGIYSLGDWELKRKFRVNKATIPRGALFRPLARPAHDDKLKNSCEGPRGG